MNPSIFQPQTDLQPTAIVSEDLSTEVTTPPTVPAPTIMPPGNNQPRGPLGSKVLKRALLTAVFAVVLTAGAVALILTTRDGQNSQSAQLAERVPPQEVELSQLAPGLTLALDNQADTLIINADTFARGTVRFFQGQFYFVLQPSSLTDNRTYQLPDASGTICTDINNCDFATNTQLAQLSDELNLQGQQLDQVSAGDIEAVFAGSGLSGGGTDGEVTLNVASGNGGIVVNPDNIALTLQVSGDSLSSTTSTGSGLEVLGGGLTLLQGCADGELLKWVEATDVWSCSSDLLGGSVNSFETVNAPAGTDPVADSGTDILNLTVAGTNLTITGTVGTDTLDFDIVESALAGSGLVAGGDALAVGAGAGITVNADDVAIRLDTTAADGTTTSSVSGLELVGGELSLIRGCAANEVLKWDNVAFEWDCAADNGAGSAWTTVDTPAGTDPVADASGDSLQFLVSGTNFTITGADNPETITFNIDESVLAGAGLGVSGDGLIVNTANGVTTSGDNVVLDQAFNPTWTADHTWTLAETEDLAVNLSISGTNSGQGEIITLTNSSTAGNQYGLYIDNAASTGTSEALLVLDNSDIDTAVSAAIQIINAGGSFTNVIDNAGTLISAAELNVLDAGITLGSETDGDYVASIIAGGGLTGDATGEGSTPTLAVGAGSGISVAADSVALGALTADWNQTGAFDIVLNNAASELRILEAVGGAFYGALDIADLTADRTYTFPDATGTVCLTTGNCAGAGSGVTTSGGSTNRIPKFTAAQNIEDSTISDDGTNVTTTIDLNVQGGDLRLGVASSQSGTLTLYNSGGSGNIALQAANPGASTFTVSLPAATGTVCLTTGNCAGVGGTGDILNNGNSFGAPVTIGTNDSQPLNFETVGTTVVTLSITGEALFKNSTNSSTAFQIQNSAGSAILVADTTADDGTADSVAINVTPDDTVGTLNGLVISQANHATNTNPLDAGLRINNADADLAIATAFQVANTGGGNYTNIFDILGTLISASEFNVLDAGITLGTETDGNYVASITAGGGLTGDVASEGSTPTLAVGAGNGITVAADSVTLDLGNSLAVATGLQVDASGLSIIETCADNELLKWTDAGGWACATDNGTGFTPTLDTVYDNDSDKQMDVDNVAGLTFDLTTTGGFFIEDAGTAFLSISDTGAFTYTLDATDDPAFTVTNNGAGNVVFNLADAGDFIVQDGGTGVFTINDSGQATFQNASNSTTAFQIQNTAGTAVLISDTANLINRPGLASSYTTTSQTATNFVTADDESNNWSHIAIGTDGLPIVSLYNRTDGDLNVLKCGNHACTSGNTTTEIANADDVGFYSSIAIGTDGLPVISYINTTDSDVMVTKCGNIACSSGNTTTQITDADLVGLYTSINISTDGLPIIAHYEGDTGGLGCGASECNLKVTKCTTASCSSSSTTEFEDADDVGNYLSATIGTDGLLIISHHNATAGDLDLRVAKCANTDCTSLTADTEFDDADDTGRDSSIAIGTDGLPIIAHDNGTGGNLQVSKCANINCTSLAADTEHVDADDTGPTDISIGTDGLPIISLYDTTTGDLQVSKCANANCTSLAADTEFPDADEIRCISMAIGSDGIPVISCGNNTDNDLQVFKCATKDCASSSGTAFTSGVDLGTLAAGFRSIYFDTLNLGDENARLVLDDSGNFRVSGLSVSSSGAVLSRNQTDSTTAFQIQNAAGTSDLFVADTTNTRIGIGIAVPLARLHISSAGTDALFRITDTTATARDVLNIADGGAVTFRNQTNSTTAFLIQNSAGSNILSVDSTKGVLTQPFVQATYVGGADASGNTNSGTGDNVYTATFVSGRYLYAVKAADATNCNTVGNKIGCELQVYDITVPSSPTFVGGGDASGNTNSGTSAAQFNSVFVAGRYAYIAQSSSGATCASTPSATGCELKIFDVSNPSAPTYVGGADASGTTNGGSAASPFLSVYVNGRYAYVGKAGDATACSQSAGSAVGCELQVYDVSNPAAPAYIGGADADGTTNGSTGSSDFNSVFVYGRYAYIGKNANTTACSQTPSAIGCELQVYNVANPAAPAYVGGADSDGTTNGGTTSSAATGVYVSGRYAYIVKNASGATCSSSAGSALGCELHVYDISNPATPTYNGGADASGTTNGGTALSEMNEVFVAGRYVYVILDGDDTACSISAGSAIGCELQVYDAANPGAPTYVGGADATGTTNGGTGSGTASHSTFNGIFVAGRYSYVAKNSSDTTACSGSAGSALRCEIQVYDISGVEASSILAHSLEAGSLQVQDSLQVFNQMSIQGGLSVGQSIDLNGDLGVAGKSLFRNGSDSTTAFRIQNAAGTSLLAVDTSGSIITFAGTTTTFITVTLSDAHFKSTQTTAPTQSNVNCGTGPTISVAAGSTDSAGKINVTTGTTAGSCAITVTFDDAYDAAPKSVVLTCATVNCAASSRDWYVSSTTTTTFVATMSAGAADATAYDFYYWVVE